MPVGVAELSRAWFERVWNNRDDAAIEALTWPDVKYQGLSSDGQPGNGLDQFKRFRALILTAFPDLKAIVEDVLVDGHKSAVRLSYTGTHLGEGLGVPPTGRKITATAIIIIYWKDSRATESWTEFDAAGMMQQLQTPQAQLRV